MALVAVLDACVLFPASLRDTLLRAAQADLYRVHLTDDILEEVHRNLVKKTLPQDKAQRLISRIREQFEDAFITHHRPLIESMPTNEKDRHVLAAAVACRANIIVTQNLKDFPPNLLAPFEVEAQSPDRFLVRLFHINRELIMQILIKQAGKLHNPSMTVPEVLATLERHAPVFVNLVRNEFGYQKDTGYRGIIRESPFSFSTSTSS
jgi:predicted nucleic acid-binding protein